MLKDCDYCDYETCVALKELGFNALVDWYFNEDKRIVSSLATYRNTYIPRISLYEAQKWLREEKEVYVTVIPEYNDYCPIKGVKYRLEVAHWKDDEFGYETIEWLDEECLHTIITFDSYEEALSEGVRASIKILQDEQKENN